MKKRFAASAMILAMSAATVLSPLTAFAEAEEQELNIAIFQGGYGDAYWNQMVELFEESHEGVKVNMTISPTIGDIIRPQIVAGNAPDFICLNDGGEDGVILSLIKDHALLNLDDVFDGENYAGTGTLRDDITDGILSSTKCALRYRIWVFVITLVIILSLIAVIGVYLYFRREDRIAIRNLNRQLTLNEETYRITARESDLCVFTYDVETEQIQFLNDKYQNLGLDQSELSVPVLLRKIREINPETCSVLRNIFARADSAEALHSQKVEVWAGGRMRYLQVKTTNLYDESGKVSRMVGSIEDITDMENDMLKLQKEARTDLLTGAMNRAAGTSAINRMLVQELHPGCVNTFAIVDLDNFKTLNDVMGHMWGDRALCEVVLIMKKHCRAQDIVCRLGGDEFVVFLPDMTREAAEESLRVLSAKLHIDYVKENLEVMISASMGIVFSDGRDITFQDLYEEADGCLYQVKRTFKGSYHISDRADREKAD